MGACSYARKNAKDFYQEHVQGPVTQIIDELIFNKRSRITDRQALDETKASLTNMLQAFNNDYGKNLSEAERQRLAKKQDMSLVEKKFGEHVEHALYNAVTGEIARVLLIQVSIHIFFDVSRLQLNNSTKQQTTSNSNIYTTLYMSHPSFLACSFFVVFTPSLGAICVMAGSIYQKRASCGYVFD